MAIVTFDPSNFKLRYPEFADISNDLLNMYFSEASIFFCNTDNSVVTNIAVRGMILCMIVAHIAALSAAPLVGRISSASEGSVSAQTAYAIASGSRAWYDQTKYGAAAWQAMTPYRCAIYIGAAPSQMTPTVIPPE